MSEKQERRYLPLTFDEWARWGLVIDTHPQKPEGWPKWEDLELSPLKRGDCNGCVYLGTPKEWLGCQNCLRMKDLKDQYLAEELKVK